MFVPLKLTCLVTLFGRKLRVFKISSKCKRSSLRLQCFYEIYSVIFKHRALYRNFPIIFLSFPLSLFAEKDGIEIL